MKDMGQGIGQDRVQDGNGGVTVVGQEPAAERAIGTTGSAAPLFREPQVVLFTRDIERSIAFWTAVGFVEVFRTPAEGTPVHVDLLLDGYRIGLATEQTTRDDHGLDPVSTGQRATIVLWTPDAPAAFARLVQLGAIPLRTPHPFLDGRLVIAWVQDPDGHVVQVAQQA